MNSIYLFIQSAIKEFRRSATSPTHSSPTVIFWCHENPLMATTPTPPSAPRVWSGNGAAEEDIAGTEWAFSVYGRPLTTVSEFNYLGRILTGWDNHWPSVVGNLQKAHKKWTWMLKIL